MNYIYIFFDPFDYAFTPYHVAPPTSHITMLKRVVTWKSKGDEHH